MKKKLIPLFIILFLVFAALGVLAGTGIFPVEQPDTPADVVTDQSAIQRNYLVVQTNSISPDSGELISAWIMFIQPSSISHIKILPLYPLENEKLHKQLTRRFSITHSGQLDPQYLHLMERKFALDIDGYILVDNTAAQYFAKTIAQQELTTLSSSPVSPEGVFSVLNTGNSVFQAFCDRLAGDGLKPISNSIDWSELLPSHFSTNLSFEELYLVIAQLETQGTIQDCSIIVAQ